MANKNGRKGSQFETDVMKWLRNAGAMAERLTKAGAKDEGDMVVIISGAVSYTHLTLPTKRIV